MNADAFLGRAKVAKRGRPSRSRNPASRVNVQTVTQGAGTFRRRRKARAMGQVSPERYTPSRMSSGVISTVMRFVVALIGVAFRGQGKSPPCGGLRRALAVVGSPA